MLIPIWPIPISCLPIPIYRYRPNILANRYIWTIPIYRGLTFSGGGRVYILFNCFPLQDNWGEVHNHTHPGDGPEGSDANAEDNCSRSHGWGGWWYRGMFCLTKISRHARLIYPECAQTLFLCSVCSHCL